MLHKGAIRFGIALVVVSLIATVLSGISHWFNLRSLERDELIASSRWPLSITVAMLLTILGFAGLWSFLSH